MTNPYQPDSAVHPGKHLEEILQTRHMTQAEVAQRLDMHKKTVNAIIQGRAHVSPDLALRLSRVFPYPAHLWSNLQHDYDVIAARRVEKEKQQAELSWLKKMPVKAMARLGWLRLVKEPQEQLNEVLRFYSVANVESWTKIYKKFHVNYRQSQRFGSCDHALSAWLRKGEMEAQHIDCADFEPKTFRRALTEARYLTREDPDIFVPRLVELCAKAGVALVFVPSLPKMRVYGCTRWLGNKALMQLSLCYTSNHQLWFTFFHEAGHILKHGKKEVFLEGKDMHGQPADVENQNGNPASINAKEKEANNFARNRLIRPAKYLRFMLQWDRSSLDAVETFAREIGIAPGIVVGCLQFDGRLDRSCGNEFKVFYQWDNQTKPDA